MKWNKKPGFQSGMNPIPLDPSPNFWQKDPNSGLVWPQRCGSWNATYKKKSWKTNELVLKTMTSQNKCDVIILKTLSSAEIKVFGSASTDFSTPFFNDSSSFFCQSTIQSMVKRCCSFIPPSPPPPFHKVNSRLLWPHFKFPFTMKISFW